MAPFPMPQFLGERQEQFLRPGNVAFLEVALSERDAGEVAFPARLGPCGQRLAALLSCSGPLREYAYGPDGQGENQAGAERRHRWPAPAPFPRAFPCPDQARPDGLPVQLWPIDLVLARFVGHDVRVAGRAFAPGVPTAGRPVRFLQVGISSCPTAANPALCPSSSKADCASSTGRLGWSWSRWMPSPSVIPPRRAGSSSADRLPSSAPAPPGVAPAGPTTTVGRRTAPLRVHAVKQQHRGKANRTGMSDHRLDRRWRLPISSCRPGHRLRRQPERSPVGQAERALTDAPRRLTPWMR